MTCTKPSISFCRKATSASLSGSSTACASCSSGRPWACSTATAVVREAEPRHADRDPLALELRDRLHAAVGAHDHMDRLGIKAAHRAHGRVRSFLRERALALVGQQRRVALREAERRPPLAHQPDVLLPAGGDQRHEDGPLVLREGLHEAKILPAAGAGGDRVALLDPRQPGLDRGMGAAQFLRDDFARFRGSFGRGVVDGRRHRLQQFSRARAAARRRRIPESAWP